MTIKSLDLSKKADFLLATGSSIAQVAQYFGRDPTEWDVQEAKYNDFVFLVLQSKQTWGGAVPSVRDSGGRRLSQLSFPYRDGQTTDDLGRLAETFDVEALIFGQDYKLAIKAFLKELEKPEAGVLIHPIRGAIKCKMRSYQMTHEHQTRKGVLLSIAFVEHNFSVKDWGFDLKTTKNFKSKIANLVAGFQVLTNLYNKVRAATNLYNNVIASVSTLVQDFQTAFSDTVVSMNSVFNKGSSIDIPALLPVNQGGVLKPDGTLASGVITPAMTPNDPFFSVPIAQIQAAIQASQQQFATAGGAGSTTFVTGDEGSQIAGVSTIGMDAETAANLSASIGAVVSQNKVNSTRALADNLINTLSALQFNQPTIAPLGTDSDGANEYSDEILDIKRITILLQEAYEVGTSTAQIGVRNYVTPRLMSIREIAFAAGLPIERVPEIDLLNAELDSVNYVAAGETVVVPI